MSAALIIWQICLEPCFHLPLIGEARAVQDASNLVLMPCCLAGAPAYGSYFTKQPLELGIHMGNAGHQIVLAVPLAMACF